MSTTYPTTIQTMSNPTSTDLLENAVTALDHDFQHTTVNDTLFAIQTKMGVTGSAVNTTFDFKLSGVVAGDKAVSKTGAETLTNKTLTAPQINMGSDATGDMYYRNGSGVFTRLPAGADGQILSFLAGIPITIANPSASDASATVKGVVELATPAELIARTANGGTGAKLVVGTDSITTVKTYDYIASATGTDAYAITTVPAITAYTAGMSFTFKADVANTDAATLNVCGVGAVSIKKGVSSDLVTGDIIASQVVTVVYDGTNFQMLSQSAQVSNTTQAQVIVSQASGNGVSGSASCATTGFSSTEPFFTICGSSGAGNTITRWVKLANGSVVATHQANVTASNVSVVGYCCVIGSYVYTTTSNGGAAALSRFDKADLANQTAMTVSGTALVVNTAIYTDGTDLWNMGAAGTGRRYTISGTTATSSTTNSYTSSTAGDATWSDGTSVYQIAIGSSAVYKWAFAGGARTTGPALITGQYQANGGTQWSTGGGIMKSSGDSSFIHTLILNTGTGFQVGKIIPITSF